MSGLVLLILLQAGPSFAAGKEKIDDTILGVIESLELIIENHRKEFKKAFSKYQKNSLSAEQIKQIKDLRITPLFMKSLLLHSEKPYVQLIKENDCNFYSLLQNGLLKTTIGIPTSIMVDVKIMQDKEEVEQAALMTLSDFLGWTYKKRCFALKEASVLFNKQNIERTIKELKFKAPKNKSECTGYLNQWKSNIYLPYMCKVKKVVDDGARAVNALQILPESELGERRRQRQLLEDSKDISDKVSYFDRQLIGNLCENLIDEEKFCHPYLAKNVWREVINGEQPFSKLSYWCQLIQGKDKLTARDLTYCSEVLEKDEDICKTKGAFNFPALFPKPNCKRISQALSGSRLKTNYHDCPGRIDNSAITNIHRILMHLKPREMQSTPDTCAYEANYSYAKLNFDYDHEEGWPMKICYYDRLEAKEQCRPYVPGESEDNKYAENNVIAWILTRTDAAPNNLKCRLVEKRKYKPILLDFRTGCWITYDRENCTTTNCPKVVYYDKKEIKGLSYKGMPTFEYFPTSYRTSRFAANKMLEEVYKLESKKIRNLTELKYYFDNTPDGILHGIACVEDLYPWHFKKQNFNGCKAIPFIVDGLFDKDGNLLMSIRTALDDLHSPRLLSWNYIFGAVVNYAKLHPTNLWALFGVK